MKGTFFTTQKIEKHIKAELGKEEESKDILPDFSFMLLPKEIQSVIFSMLDKIQELAKAELLSKICQKNIRNEGLWMKKFNVSSREDYINQKIKEHDLSITLARSFKNRVVLSLTVLGTNVLFKNRVYYLPENEDDCAERNDIVHNLIVNNCSLFIFQSIYSSNKMALSNLTQTQLLGSQIALVCIVNEDDIDNYHYIKKINPEILMLFVVKEEQNLQLNLSQTNIVIIKPNDYIEDFYLRVMKKIEEIAQLEIVESIKEPRDIKFPKRL